MLLLLGMIQINKEALCHGSNQTLSPARLVNYSWGILYPACALRARGKTFDGSTKFFTETAVTPERKVEKSFPRSEINRHGEG